MGKLTLDEAIKQHEAIAAEQRELYGLCPCPCNGLTDCKCLKSGKDMGCMKLHYEHQQLTEWLMQLKEAKRLLKSAIDEWHLVCEWGNCGEYCGWFKNGQCTQEWSNKAEALKLIGDENDAE